MDIDQNGNTITKDIQHESDGTWTALVWVGSNPAHNIRRYRYKTRETARNSSITDAFPRDQPDEYIGIA